MWVAVCLFQFLKALGHTYSEVGQIASGRANLSQYSLKLGYLSQFSATILLI